MASRVEPQVVLNFVDEVRGYLPLLRQGLAACGREPSNSATVAEVYRYVHNIRTAASMVGLAALSRIAATMEGTLEAAHKEGQALDAEGLAGLGRNLAYIESAVAGVGSRRPESGSQAPSPAEMGAEILADFHLEASEHLDELARRFAELEAQPEDAVALGEIQRRVHTLKGAAATVGFATVSVLAHRMEDLLEARDEGRVAVSSEEGFRLLVRSADAVAECLREGETERTNRLAGELEKDYARLLGPLPPGLRRDFEAPRTASPSPRSEAAPRSEVIRVPLMGLEQVVRAVTELFSSRTAFEQQLEDLADQAAEFEVGIERLKSLSERLDRQSEVSAMLHRASTFPGSLPGQTSQAPAEDTEDTEDSRSLAAGPAAEKAAPAPPSPASTAWSSITTPSSTSCRAISRSSPPTSTRWPAICGERFRGSPASSTASASSPAKPRTNS